ncbi:MAG: protein kinase [Acidobacteriota bacterium]|nr:protein kinase [Acidobacteriota bacterium]
MKADRFKQVDEILDAALDLPASEREAFISTICSGDDSLRHEILSLLSAEKKTNDFLENSAMNLMAHELAAERKKDSSFSFVGKEIGGYKIEKQLGAGGMGEVYLARDRKLERKVALKILPAEFVVQRERVRRFEREARAVSALNHPNIVTVYDVGESDGWHFIATEFIEGKTVRELISENIKLKEILSIAAQTAEALAAAHSAGIVHRDIKPENIMVRADGYVKVLDFGLAKLTETSKSGSPDHSIHQTQAGIVMGTLAYMSPEQAAGDSVDERTDIWSLGVVLYEMATGKKPFSGGNQRDAVNQILMGEPCAASESNPNLSPEFDRVLCKALEKDPELRYQTAGDFRADLKRLKREIDSSTSLNAVKQTPKTEEGKSKKRWLRSAAIAAGLLVLFAVAGFSLYQFWKTNTGAPDWTKASNLQLTDHAATEFYPALAPDGKTFVYASDADGNFDIYLQRVGGKNPTNLTQNSPADDTQPAFSPDGLLIAFRSEREPRGIYVMEATGENVRRVSEDGFQPSWSPDGKEIVFSTVGRSLPDFRNSFPSALWIVNLETRDRRMLTESDVMQPAWSPNGHRIAFWFTSPEGGKRHVATIPSGGGEISVIPNDATTNWNPVWSPDGKFLYFASNRGGNMNFWRVAIDETSGAVLSEPEAVVTPSKYSRHLNFSRDGKRLIYVSTNNKSNVQAIEFDPKTERTIGEPFWITQGDREILRPELSPDGKQFAMNVVRRTHEDIIIMNRDGSNQRDIKSDQAFDRYPRWSPDGKKLSFISDQSGKYQIYIINADGSGLRQMALNNDHETSLPIWSPDGKKLYLRRGTEQFIIDSDKPFDEQTPRRLPQPPDPQAVFHAWDWSRDGKRLLGLNFKKGAQTEVTAFSLETNSYETIFNSGNAPTWLSDGKRFVLSHESKAFLVNAETKKGRELVSRLPDRIINVRISRDDKLLYYVVQMSENDIWMLDLE